MASFLSRIFPSLAERPELPSPGLYHWMTPDDAPIQYRLHLRVEDEGMGVLIVNAATVLHLNATATEHALQLIQGADEAEAARTISARYRVSHQRALADHRNFKEQIQTLATNPQVDPVLFLDMNRTEPLDETPSAPYRIDLALTYRCDASGAIDPLARRRVDRELSTDEWKGILETIWNAGVPHVTFTGGEPTLRQDLIPLIAFAEKSGQVTGLLTDGKRLSDGDYVSQLAQAGLDHILITFDPSQPDSQQGVLNALQSDVFTAIHLTITQDSKDTVREQLEQLKAWGVKAVSLSAADQSRDLIDTLAQAREIAADLGLDLIWDLPVPYSANNPLALELEIPPLGAGKKSLYIEPDGDVLPAQGVAKVLGNLVRESWEQVWSSTLKL